MTVGAGVRTSQQRHVGEVIIRHGAELITAYEAGASIADLAVHGGVSYPTLRAFLKAEGVALRDDRGRCRKRGDVPGSNAVTLALVPGVPGDGR